MALHLNSDDLNIIHWWGDSSYGVHDDLKGHTGATVSNGGGGGSSFRRNRRLTPPAPHKGKLLEYMTPPHRLFLFDISCQTKD